MELGRGETAMRVLVSIFSLGQGPEPPGLLVIVRDLEPVQELENVVNYSGRLARLGGLISGVAHQIRNPLNAMNLQLELLNAEAAQGKPVEARVMKVRNEITRLDEAISALLRFMRPEQLKLAQIELGDLLREVGREVERPGITVKHTLDAVASQVTADRALLGEALRNIAKNAVEAMPDGGEIEFETQLSDDGYVEISIKDRGQGIPAEHLSHIFNLYYTTKEGGSGLGLSLALRAVDLHYGMMEVQSNPGAGTIVKIKLPAGTRSRSNCLPERQFIRRRCEKTPVTNGSRNTLATMLTGCWRIYVDWDTHTIRHTLPEAPAVTPSQHHDANQQCHIVSPERVVASTQAQAPHPRLPM